MEHERFLPRPRSARGGPEDQAEGGDRPRPLGDFESSIDRLADGFGPQESLSYLDSNRQNTGQ